MALVDRLAFAFTALLAAIALGANPSAAQLCSWCEAGDSTCDWEFSSYVQDVFPTSISPSVGGRGYPYFRPEGQVTLGEANPVATLAVIVHHGAARNGENYTSYMTNAVINGDMLLLVGPHHLALTDHAPDSAGLDLSSVLVIGAQVYETGDYGLDTDSHIW